MRGSDTGHLEEEGEESELGKENIKREEKGRKSLFIVLIVSLSWF